MDRTARLEHLSDRSPPSGACRPLIVALWAAVIAGTAGASRLMLWYWPGSIFLREKSGVWTALAWNFAHGEFYRSSLSPNGYGGTRYMPLFFVAHGALIRAGLDPISTGVVLMHTSVVAAAAALFVALRTAQVPARLAMPLAATCWCTVIYQQSCTDLNPDYLAAALALAGASLALRSERPRGPLWLAAAAATFTLAGLAKVTALGFTVPIALWLWLEGRRATAVWIAGATTVFFAGAAAMVQFASAGQFLESFRATITGGTTLSDVAHALPKFGRELIIKPFDVAAPFAVACWCVLTAARRREAVERRPPSWPHLYLLAAALLTLGIFVSPGTASNHLVDLQMASTLVVGVALSRGELSPRAAASMYAALAAVLVAISWPVPGIPSVVAEIEAAGPRRRAVVQAIHAEFLPAGAPYLSIDPIVPVLNNERPFLLDDFNLERFIREGAPPGRDVEQRVRRHFFNAIVLHDNSDFPHDMNAGDPGFSNDCQKYWADQDSPLMPLLRSAYEVRAVRKPFVILTAVDDVSTR
jgi:hypothetical protein